MSYAVDTPPLASEHNSTRGRYYLRHRLRQESSDASSAAERHFTPIAVIDVDLSSPLEGIPPIDPAGRRYGAARVVVRLHTRPLGELEVGIGEDGLTASALAKAIFDRLGGKLNEHLRRDGLPEIAQIDGSGSSPVSSPRCLQRREAVLRDAPQASVLVVTRDRADVVSRCLRSLERLSYPNFETVVVDGSAADDTADLIRAQFPRVKYVRLERGGICVARNRGLREVSGTIVAFTDDDAVVNRHWLTELVSAFDAGGRVACTTGLVLPLEIDTRAQLLYEEAGAFVDGFDRRVIGLQNQERGSLLPYATGRIGAGVSMAWRTSVLRNLGGFDLALDGVGADDLAVFFDALCEGFQIVYEPGAVVYHEHRRTYAELRKQIHRHYVGLGAHLTRCVVTRPGRIPDFLGRVPAGLYYGFSPSSAVNRKKSATYPSDLTRIGWRGVIQGPSAYIKGLRRAGVAGPRLSVHHE